MELLYSVEAVTTSVGALCINSFAQKALVHLLWPLKSCFLLFYVCAYMYMCVCFSVTYVCGGQRTAVDGIPQVVYIMLFEAGSLD